MFSKGCVGFFIALLALQAAAEPNVCSVCTIVVNTLEGFVGKSVTKNQLLDKLDNICVQLQGVVDVHECNNLVELYGGYTIDLLLSNIEPSNVCSNLGLCRQTNDKGPVYEVLYPNFTEDAVVYSKEQTEKKSESHFKFFIGNTTALLGTSMSDVVLEFTKTNAPLHADVYVLDSKQKRVNLASFDCEAMAYCSSVLFAVTDGTWYFVDVNGESTFHLTARQEASKIDIMIEPVETNDMPIMFIALMMGGLTLCCCALIYRCCLVPKRCKKAPVAVPLQEVEVPAPQEGYYYPQGYAVVDGQYYYPVAPQSYPAFVNYE